MVNTTWVKNLRDDEFDAYILSHEKSVRATKEDLGALKAEKARREAEAKKTVGQRVAETLFVGT